MSPVPADTLTDNIRFLRALIARPKQIGALAPSSRGLARAIARQLDPACSGSFLEVGPGTGVITKAILERGIAPERLTVIEYDAEFAAAIAARFHGVNVIHGDAFDLARTLGARHAERFAGIVSGLPLLNFPVSRRHSYIEALCQRLLPGRRPDPIFLWRAGAGRGAERPQRDLRQAGLGQSAAGQGMGVPKN